MFRIRVNVTLFGLKDQLDQINGHLNHIEPRRVDHVEYRRQSIDSDGSSNFTQMKLWNDDNVRTMFSTFDQYSSKGLIELDNSIVWYFYDIWESMIRSKTHEKTKACMDRLEEG